MPSSNLPLSSLLSALSKNPNIIEDILDIDGCLQFVELLHIMKPTLQLYQSQGETTPLQSLPRNVHDFIRVSLQLEHEHTKLLWEVLRDVAWEIELEIKDLQSYAARYLQVFLDHGPARGIGMSRTLNDFLSASNLHPSQIPKHFTISCHQLVSVLIQDALLNPEVEESCFSHGHLLKCSVFLSQCLPKTLALFQDYPLCSTVVVCPDFSFHPWAFI